MTIILVIFLVSFALSVVLTPVVGKVGTWLGAVDVPDERKVHTGSIPRCGGLAIFVAFFLSLLICAFLIPDISDKFELTRETGFFVLGMLVVFGVGIVDDFHSLGHKIKFLFQIIGASVAFWGGIRISSFAFIGIPFECGWISYFVTVFWFLLFINAINLIDGLDGLAAGICFFASSVMSILLIVKGDIFHAVLFTSLAGVLFGFLRYNFNPATIFMGDSGSYFLGYTIASLAIMSSVKCQIGTLMMIPVIALGVPIFDALLSPVRRFLVGRGMFKADRSHIHHRLIAMGLSTKRVVWITYGITVVLCIFAIIMVNLRDEFAGLFLIVLTLGAVIFIRKIGYFEYFTHEKIFGWLKDVTDTAGFSPERRSFLELQIEISKSRDIRELWGNTCRALKMLEFDIAEFKFLRRKDDIPMRREDDKVPECKDDDAPAGQSHFGEYWIPEKERRKNGEDNLFMWKRGDIDVTQYACKKHPLLKLELPLVDATGERAIGVLWLVKDLRRDQISHYTLRRVEHLRRTMIGVLTKLQK